MFEHGSTWLKADFHLHTRKDKEFYYPGEENSFIKTFISRLKAEGVSVGVITNHNKFDEGEYKALRKNGKKENILILPGVELSVKEANGIHTLIIFDPDSWLVNGENFISHFLTEAFAGIANAENRNTRCKFDLRDVIEKLNTYGRDYFIVFAHVDQTSGLMHECNGGLLESLSEINGFQERVLALQKVRNTDTMATFQKWFGYSCAQVEGSDPKSLERVGHYERATYIKIGDLSYDAVKFALIDYQNRVSRSAPEIGHGYIESISFKGGKLNGETITFSPELNTLIGIRGSGKSSVIEVLRYAFSIEAQSDKEYKDGLVKAVLGSGGQVIVQVVDKFGKRYEVRRIFGERPNILDADGNDLGITVDQILKNTLYFGQKDLSQSSSYELQLLDRLVGNKIGDNSKEMEQHYSELEDAIKHLIDISAIPAEIEELETKQSNLEHSLQIFEERGVADKLKKQTAFDLDLQKLSNTEKSILADIKAVESAIAILKVESITLDTYESVYNGELFKTANTILTALKNKLAQIKEFIKDIKADHEEFASVLEQLEKRIESLKDEFAEIKRQIGDTELDVDAYSSLKTGLEETKGQIKDLRKKATSREKLYSAFRTALRKRNELLLKEFQAYETEVRAINESQPELVVEIIFKGDKDKFKDILKSTFRGTSIKDSKYQMLAEQFSDFAALIEDVIINAGGQCRRILADSEYEKLEEKILSKYAELIRRETPNRVEIKYHGKLLKQHSLGQRASALVLFILTQSDNDVIVIDQPEDDLDNKVIYDEVIQAIRHKKPDIQFLFATHNANIPVLGDAEKIVVADYREGIITTTQGNIDFPETHKMIVDIMEGGQEAFRRRQLIYTAWK
ncbi:MAG: TrlF family AAA-like ATPase [Bacillota bacterium]